MELNVNCALPWIMKASALYPHQSPQIVIIDPLYNFQQATIPLKKLEKSVIYLYTLFAFEVM